MRTPLLSIASLLVLQVAGQCPFDPTITPNQVILCPNSTQLLSTQAYDSWQWYKDGVAIDGATQQTYTTSGIDGGSEITVACSLNGCTEMSPGVLIDDWMFLLPYVIHGGDEPYSMGLEGELVFCEGDTLELTMGQPYTESIQWTNNGVAIPGATQPTLIVTEAGGYSVSGAPSVCPNYIQDLGLTIYAYFTGSVYPALVPGDGELCVYPAIANAQWFLDGAPFGTGACIAMTTPGVYTAFADYGQPCQRISEPFVFTGIAGPTGPLFTVVRIADQLNVLFQGAVTPSASWDVLDASGRIVRSGRVPAQGTLTVDLSGEAGGVYFFRTSMGAGQRFTLVR